MGLLTAIGATVATLAAGKMSSDATKHAADKSSQAISDASDKSTELQREIYYDNRNLLTPSIEAGASAEARRMLMLGYSPDEVKTYLRSQHAAVAGGGSGATPQTPPAVNGAPNISQFLPAGANGQARIDGLARYQQALTAWKAKSGIAGDGPSLAAFSTDDSPEQRAQRTADYQTQFNTWSGGGGSGADDPYAWVDSYNPGEYLRSQPGYKFQLNEGREALERSAAAKGNLFSGATGKALHKYGQDYGASYWDRLYGNLGDLSGAGEDSTGTVINLGENFGQAAGGNIMTSGQARASSYQQSGEANANFWGNTVPGAIGTVYGAGRKSGWKFGA